MIYFLDNPEQQENKMVSISYIYKYNFPNRFINKIPFF